MNADGWEEYIGRVFNRWRQMRSKKDGSLPKPHWAKWDSRWIPGLAPYIKVGWLGLGAAILPGLDHERSHSLSF